MGQKYSTAEIHSGLRRGDEMLTVQSMQKLLDIHFEPDPAANRDLEEALVYSLQHCLRWYVIIFIPNCLGQDSDQGKISPDDLEVFLDININYGNKDFVQIRADCLRRFLMLQPLNKFQRTGNSLGPGPIGNDEELQYQDHDLDNTAVAFAKDELNTKLKEYLVELDKGGVLRKTDDSNAVGIYPYTLEGLAKHIIAFCRTPESVVTSGSPSCTEDEGVDGGHLKQQNLSSLNDTSKSNNSDLNSNIKTVKGLPFTHDSVPKHNKGNRNKELLTHKEAMSLWKLIARDGVPFLNKSDFFELIEVNESNYKNHDISSSYYTDDYDYDDPNHGLYYSVEKAELFLQEYMRGIQEHPFVQ